MVGQHECRCSLYQACKHAMKFILIFNIWRHGYFKDWLPIPTRKTCLPYFATHTVDSWPYEVNLYFLDLESHLLSNKLLPTTKSDIIII